MSATWSEWDGNVEQLLSDLNDAALKVIMGHGARTASVYVELELWDALNETLAGEDGRHSGETVLASLADAAYQVALQSGTDSPFVEVELDLWKAFRRIGRQPRYRSFFPLAAPAARPAVLVG
jgi:hypothetical protein